MLNGRSPKPIVRHNEDRRLARDAAVAVITHHLAQTMQKQIVSWMLVGGLLVGGLALHLVWWSFIGAGAYLWWLSRTTTRHGGVLPQHATPARGVLDGGPDLPLPSVQWLDVMPDEVDFRAALATLMPDHGAALFGGYAPYGQRTAVDATRQIQRALFHQQKLLLDSSALIAYASDFKFPVAMIALPDTAAQLDRLPAAPARMIVQSEDGPWLLMALGEERALVRQSSARATAAAARPAEPPPPFQIGRAPSTGTTELELHLPPPARVPTAALAVPEGATVGGESFEAMFASMLASAPQKKPLITPAEQQAILAAALAGTMEWGPARTVPSEAVSSAQAGSADRAHMAVAVPVQPRSSDITLGYNRETGEPVTIPIAALSGILAVAFGIPRTGKTSSLEGLVQRTSQAGMPWGIAYDTKPEWHGLRSATDPAEAIPLIILGDNADDDVQMPTHGLSQTLLDLPEKTDEKRERLELLTHTLTSWQRTIEWLMEHRQSWICDLSSERIGMEGSSRVLTAVFLAAVRSARRHRQPFGILIDEAQNALPQGRIRKQLWEAAMGITRTAPSLGVTTFLAAHRPTDIDKDLIAPARLRILHRVDLPLDIEAYSKMLPWPYEQVQRTVELLQPGEAIVYGSNLLSSGNAPVVVRMMPATTFHVGYTPAIGVVPPVSPPRISIAPAILEAIAQIPGALVPRQIKPAGPAASSAASPAPANLVPRPTTPLDNPAPGESASGRLELLIADRWPEDVQSSVAVMLRNPSVRTLILRADRIGVTLPLSGEAAGTPLPRKARLVVLARTDLLALLAAARAGGVEQKPLARLMFGIADPGRAGNELGAAINDWEAAQRGEANVAAASLAPEGGADDSSE